MEEVQSLNKLQHELTGYAQTTIPTLFFFKVNTILLLDNLPEKKWNISL